MYRASPTACLACGSFLDPTEADLTDVGLRCWRCSTRGDVAELQAAMQRRPRWRRWIDRLHGWLAPR